MNLQFKKLFGMVAGTGISTYMIILLPAIIIYSQTLSFDFTSWDDETNISKNPCLQKLNLENINTILLPGKMPGEQLYIPVTYTSYLVESAVFGIKSSVIHFDNILIHLINSILVFSFSSLLLRNRMASIITALLFSLHPLQVEAVAWCMGRKDLLMTMFALLCLIKFTEFATTSSKKAYMWAMVFFFAAVFSKPSAFVLPLILPVLNWYFKGRFDREFLLRLIPFFVISAVVCLINSKLDMNTFGHDLKFVMFRFAFIPAVAHDWYSRILMLDDPSAYYSWYDYYNGSCITISGLVLVLSLLTITVYAFMRNMKVLFLGLSFVIVMSLPAALLVSWTFRDFITADRYGYLPLVGVFLLAGSGLMVSGKKLFRIVFLLTATLFLCLAAWKSYFQIGVWKNSETLWSSVVKVHPDSFIAHYNLGNYYFKAKHDLKLAESHYRKANSITPDSDTWFNLGIICELTNRKEEAAVCYARAVVLDPASPHALRKYAITCYARGDFERALRCFLRLTEIVPESPDAYLYIGKIYDMRGQKDMALAAFMCYERLKKQGR